MSEPMAIDFETYLIGPGDPCKGDPSSPFPKPVCISYCKENKSEQGVAVGDEMENIVKEALESPFMIVHNAVFECGVIFYWFPKLRGPLFKALFEGRIICTQIVEELKNLQRKSKVKTNLAALVNYYFKEDISADKKDPDAWRLRYSELDGIPLKDWPKKAYKYALDDSIWALKVYNIQKDYKIDIKRAMRAAFWLNIMGSYGIKVDNSRVLKLEEEIYKALQPKYDYLIEKEYCSQIVNRKRPKKNMKELRELIKETVKSPRMSMKGNIKTDKEALKDYYVETKNQVFKYFLDVNVYDKVLTAYIKNLKGNSLIRSGYSVTKSTGRTSSSGTKNYPSVNIQQMPRKVPDVTWDVRNCFVPRPGYKIVSIDYSGLELASAAHQLYSTFGWSKMRDALNEGDTPTDMHSKLACRIMSIQKKKSITYEQFLANKKEPEYAHFRQLCKAINLGFPGGLGYDTMRQILLQDDIRTKFKVLEEFSYAPWNVYFQIRREEPNVRVARLSKDSWGLVYDELVGFKNEFLSLYPELRFFLKKYHLNALTGDKKNVLNDYGEWEEEPMYQYEIQGFRRQWCTYTAYCNGFLMQTPSALGATSMVSKIMETYINDNRVNPLAFIHDEVVFEVLDCPEKYDIIKELCHIMITEMQKILTSVRIAVEAEEMNYWMKSGGSWTHLAWREPYE